MIEKNDWFGLIKIFMKEKDNLWVGIWERIKYYIKVGYCLNVGY